MRGSIYVVLHFARSICLLSYCVSWYPTVALHLACFHAKNTPPSQLLCLLEPSWFSAIYALPNKWPILPFNSGTPIHFFFFPFRLHVPTPCIFPFPPLNPLGFYFYFVAAPRLLVGLWTILLLPCAVPYSFIGQRAQRGSRFARYLARYFVRFSSVTSFCLSNARPITP